MKKENETYIKDLKINENIQEITLKVIHKPETETIESHRTGQKLQKCDIIVEDKKGDTVPMTLWEQECGQLERGNTFTLTDGWCREWQNKLTLSTGKNGKITKK